MINIGIIGAGRIGQVHARTIRFSGLDARIAAMADPYLTDQARGFARELAIPAVTLDYREILQDPKIDAVLICSSTDTHSAISVEAIRAGKHVFCEKPIDHDLGKIRLVRQALEENPVTYQVGFQRRFDHNFQAVRQAVAEGKIGEIHTVKITSRDPEPPPIPYIKVSGGLFLDMMIHDFDMVRFLSGSEVAEVFALGAVLVDPAIGEAGDVDTAVVTLKLKNGALAVIDNSRRATFGHDQRAEVFGSRGAVATGNDTPSTAQLSNESGVHGEKPYWFFLERYEAAYRKEIHAFLEAINRGTPPPVTVNDGLEPVRIGLAAQKSHLEKRPVSLDEISE